MMCVMRFVRKMVTRVFFLLLILAWLKSGEAAAKPLLKDSQDTFASACIERGADDAELVEICTLGLEDEGASQAQRLQMMEQLGWAYFELDREDEAEATFRTMVEINPQSFDGLTGLGWMVKRRGQYGEAADLFRRAMDVSPAAEALAGFASSAYNGGEIDTETALERLDVALAIDPEYRWALREKGWIFEEEDRDAEAADAFRAALDLYRDDANAHYGLSIVLYNLDRLEKALVHASAGLDLDPEHARMRSRRALILNSLDRPKQALKDAKHLIAAYPDWSEGYVRQAQALAGMGRRKHAIEVLAAADEKIGYDSFLVYWFADLLFDDSRYKDALAQIERSVGRASADEYDHRLHAIIAINLSDFPLARRAVDAALKANPKDEYAIYYDALVLLGEADFTTAERRFDDAIAAGLSKSRLSDFLSELVAEGQIVQAVQMRFRYNRETE